MTTKMIERINEYLRELAANNYSDNAISLKIALNTGRAEKYVKAKIGLLNYLADLEAKYNIAFVIHQRNVDHHIYAVSWKQA